MRAVNLLPPDLRSGPKGSAPAVSTGVENSGAGAFVVLGVLAFAVVALAAYVLAGPDSTGQPVANRGIPEASGS